MSKTTIVTNKNCKNSKKRNKKNMSRTQTFDIMLSGKNFFFTIKNNTLLYKL